MTRIENDAQRDELLTRPNAADIDLLSRLPGDIIILGAGGKMGPTLARRIRRAAEAAGRASRVMAVSRSASTEGWAALQHAGVDTITCDLLNTEEVARLPRCENVLFLAGRKFGSIDRSDLTWAINALVPANVARHFRSSRIVAFSTGNVYPFASARQGGCTETDVPAPVGEYAQSCLARERIFEYYSREFSTRCLIFRLNYAVDLRYGILADIARQVYAGQPVDVSVPAFNVIWQGDANSYALRSLDLASTPPRWLNVTGPETLWVRETASFYAARFGREVSFTGRESDSALLSNAAECHAELGFPEVTASELMEWVAHWVEIGGASLNKPTKFQVTDGRF
jgi:nucleoside-diphosphate-sugar epimerase